MGGGLPPAHRDPDALTRQFKLMSYLLGPFSTVVVRPELFGSSNWGGRGIHFLRSTPGGGSSAEAGTGSRELFSTVTRWMYTGSLLTTPMATSPTGAFSTV